MREYEASAQRGDRPPGDTQPINVATPAGDRAAPPAKSPVKSSANRPAAPAVSTSRQPTTAVGQALHNQRKADSALDRFLTGRNRQFGDYTSGFVMTVEELNEVEFRFLDLLRNRVSEGDRRPFREIYTPEEADEMWAQALADVREKVDA